jgi:hypothetical protein
MAVRKRRNVAKGTVHLVVLVGLICVYWDYLTGCRGWSLTYAVPILDLFHRRLADHGPGDADRSEGAHPVQRSEGFPGLPPLGFLGLGWTVPRWWAFEGFLGALLAALDGGVITSIHGVVDQHHGLL